MMLLKTTPFCWQFFSGIALCGVQRKFVIIIFESGSSWPTAVPILQGLKTTQRAGNLLQSNIIK